MKAQQKKSAGTFARTTYTLTLSPLDAATIENLARRLGWTPGEALAYLVGRACADIETPAAVLLAAFASLEPGRAYRRTAAA